MCEIESSGGTKAMRKVKNKWQRSDFFILDAVEYRPEIEQVWVRFETGTLEKSLPARSGRSDWGGRIGTR